MENKKKNEVSEWRTEDKTKMVVRLPTQVAPYAT